MAKPTTQVLNLHASRISKMYPVSTASIICIFESQVARTDSFLSLAVRYGVEPTAIKRVNNMISDHSLHSRIVVYIPVASAEQLKGRVVQLRYCSAAKRDVAVVLQESNDDLDALMQSTRAHEAKAQVRAESP